MLGGRRQEQEAGQYSHVFRRPRGLHISYPYRHEIFSLLNNARRKMVVSPGRLIDARRAGGGARLLLRGCGHQGSLLPAGAP